MDKRGSSVEFLTIDKSPRALAACVHYVNLLPTWNKDYLSIYNPLRPVILDILLIPINQS